MTQEQTNNQKYMYNLMGGYKLSQSEKIQMTQFAEKFIGQDGIVGHDFDGSHLNFYDKDLNLLSRLSVYQLFHYDVLDGI
jgi:hypothetical protein